MSGPVEIARAAWGADLPDWIEALALECSRSSQAKVAKKLGYSGGLVSQVLNRKYPASLVTIEERFNGVFRDAVVDCPQLGILPVNECQDWRAKSGTFSVGNPQRTAMFRACNRCPRNIGEGQA